MASSVLDRLVSKSEIISDLDSQHNDSLLNSNFISKCFFSAYISEKKFFYFYKDLLQHTPYHIKNCDK